MKPDYYLPADFVLSHITNVDVFWVWFQGLGTILTFSPSCSGRRSGCGSGMCPNLGPFIQGSRSHSSQSWLRCPDSATPSPSYSSPSLRVTRSGCLNPGIRINPTVPSCAPELRDFFFTYLEISLVKPCGFLWWARFLRFDLGLGVPDWSLIGSHRAHMSTLIQYSLQENPMNIDLIVTQ